LLQAALLISEWRISPRWTFGKTLMLVFSWRRSMDPGRGPLVGEGLGAGRPRKIIFEQIKKIFS
jgi:hypothetical protein